MKTKKLPNLSIIIPCYNESRHIRTCLESILKNSYPLEKIELLIIDGMSTDNTLQILKEFSENYPQIHVLKNPDMKTPIALNIGIKHSTYKIIIALGAHAIYDQNYLLHSVQTLLREKCASTGGVISPTSDTMFGKAIAAATSSRFGIGNAKYRYATEKTEVDTVYGGCWHKKDVLAIGGFNETLVRNQDYEFNSRLRKQVGPIILNPEIKCQYFCRDNLKDLSKQYFQYGFWRYKSAKEFGAKLNLRQLIPLVFLLGLTLSLMALLAGYKLGFFIPALYLSFIFMASALLSAKHKKISFLFQLPLIFSTIHLAWPTGFIWSSFKAYIRNTINN